MDLNDVPASANKRLLTDILRGDLGFKGVFSLALLMACGLLSVSVSPAGAKPAAAIQYGIM